MSALFLVGQVNSSLAYGRGRTYVRLTRYKLVKNEIILSNDILIGSRLAQHNSLISLSMELEQLFVAEVYPGRKAWSKPSGYLLRSCNSILIETLHLPKAWLPFPSLYNSPRWRTAENAST